MVGARTTKSAEKQSTQPIRATINTRKGTSRFCVSLDLSCGTAAVFIDWSTVLD
jgi:hypothetical protein